MSSTILHPALPQLGRPLTFEEWAAMDEDEPGEWVDGRLEEEEVPDLIHELVVSWLIHVRCFLVLDRRPEPPVAGDLRADRWPLRAHRARDRGTAGGRSGLRRG